MNMKQILILLLGGLILFSSCTDGLKDKGKEALYAITKDSTVTIYKSGAKEPVILTKPIMLEDLKKFSIPYDVIISSEAAPGMSRYVDGEENDNYVLSMGGAVMIFLGLILIIIIFVLIIAGMYGKLD